VIFQLHLNLILGCDSPDDISALRSMFLWEVYPRSLLVNIRGICQRMLLVSGQHQSSCWRARFTGNTVSLVLCCHHKLYWKAKEIKYYKLFINPFITFGFLWAVEFVLWFILIIRKIKIWHEC